METPDDGIFKPYTTHHQIGSIEICDTGWERKKVTPEDNPERISKLETDVQETKKDVTDL